MRKSIRRGFAGVLAAFLMVSAQPSILAGASPVEQTEAAGDRKTGTADDSYNVADVGGGTADSSSGTADISSKAAAGSNGTVDISNKAVAGSNSTADISNKTADISNGTADTNHGTADTSKKTASASNAAQNPGGAVKDKKGQTDAIFYNTGNFRVCVVKEEEAESIAEEVMIDVFDDNGDYTIPIPEMNPFFPYEVQFTQNGKTESRWFMNPEDSVTIGGHTFYVKAEFDGTAVTQMSLKVGEDVIVVYPEKKEFTDNGGIMPLSLLPLEERDLTVDLTGYTPPELTMVSVDSIFTGNDALADMDQVMWTSLFDDSYKVIAKDGYMDLSRDTYRGLSYWEMIVGDNDQLDSNNIRYIVHLNTTESKNWLIPTVYFLDDSGSTMIESEILANGGHYDYHDYDATERWLDIYDSGTNDYAESYIAVKLKLNQELFTTSHFDHFKVYSVDSSYQNAADPARVAEEGEDITDALFTEGGGVITWDLLAHKLLAIVTYDSSGNITGCMPFRIWLTTLGNSVDPVGLYAVENGLYQCDVGQSFDVTYHENVELYTYALKYGYAADGIYHLNVQYSEEGIERNDNVTAAYVGLYDSIEEAKEAGAQDIKDSLFARGSSEGYAADYSKTIFFTIFVKPYGSEWQNVYQYGIKTVEGMPKSSTGVWFLGLADADETYVNCYVADTDLDSYGEGNYLTIFADKAADLTKLALIFSLGDGVQLYAEGSSAPEISRKCLRDFSRGPVLYMAFAENGIDSKNYWIHVIKAEEGSGKLYINSLSDKNAETREESGVIYSTREMFLDGRHEYRHDILIANVGTEAIANLSAEVVSNEVELDDYWTLKGKHELAGLNTLYRESSEGELPNLAKLRLVLKDGVNDGREIKGTLTIKSGETVLMVLTLTGVAGDPGITTQDIPDAVKYAHYATTLQNGNKYSWNKVSYFLTDGELPDGMWINQNGELYGVPTETGDFTFTVRMENSFEDFADCEKTFTLTVVENTDANVEAATDEGYALTVRVKDITLRSNVDQLMVSEGEYDLFVDLVLDGVKLTKGVDYVAEPGSTRLTIRSQTLKASNKVGTHTLSMEFRTKDTNTLKRAVQNYRVTAAGGSSDEDSGSSNGGSGSSSDRDSENSDYGQSSGSQSAAAMTTRDAKKGYVHALTGIITGTGNGYARWIHDGIGWKFMYADETYATGHMVKLEDGSEAEQVLWEKINNSWFAFGADGYLRSGWIYDYQLGSWYGASEESGRRSGWYTDPQDNYTYYLDPETGKLTCGWKNIENSWYYFNAVIAPRTWEFDESTGNWYYNVKSTMEPYGALYRDKVTPDGYQVNADGVWEEN